jgi:hypothetical protein
LKCLEVSNWFMDAKKCFKLKRRCCNE